MADFGVSEFALAASATAAATSAYGAYQQGQASSAAATYQAAVARNNQIVANQNATYATQQGQAMEASKREQTAQLLGKERAMAGAAGVDSSSGSPLRLQGDTSRLGEVDALTIRDNAARSAYGYQTQGLNFQAEAGLDMMKSRNATAGGALGAFSSIAGGASSVSDKWARYDDAGLI